MPNFFNFPSLIICFCWIWLSSRPVFRFNPEEMSHAPTILGQKWAFLEFQADTLANVFYRFFYVLFANIFIVMVILLVFFSSRFCKRSVTIFSRGWFCLNQVHGWIIIWYKELKILKITSNKRKYQCYKKVESTWMPECEFFVPKDWGGKRQIPR